MASAGDFDGDEFSNNLFSDLAPLITLFGEQVTMQFLSMSLGWADNFLLAMGPLGIITTVTSAIRIGGSRWLKSLIGRARETDPVAEQELLPSTSVSVCELWNGQQVTRLVGQPEGMVTVVSTRDGQVCTLLEAFQKRSLERSFQNESLESDENSDENNSGGDSATDFNIEHKAALLDLSLPPNLSLNTSAPTTSRSTEWWLAGLGVVLQTFAIVFPGIATYRFRWNKGESSVPEYGYPCFAAGTVGLTLGILLCGHIIEGATLVTDYKLSKHAKENGGRIISLQKASTIGDQKFPSCAIILGGRNGTLRLSRRHDSPHGYTWSRATAPILITLAGYIVQFVGLRALHWSATIIQLAVTLVMTGVRAFARRRLASQPEISHHSLPGQEAACLALRLRFEAERRPSGGSLEQSCRRNPVANLRFNAGNEEKVVYDEDQFFWELISDHSEESSVVLPWLRRESFLASSNTHSRDASGFIRSQLLQRSQGPMNVSVEFLTKDAIEGAESNIPTAAGTLQIYEQIARRIGEFGVTTADDESLRASEALSVAMERTLILLDKSGGLIWKDDVQGQFENEEQGKQLSICWGFDIRDGRVSDYHEKERLHKRLKVTLRREPNGSRLWHLDSSNALQLRAAISLSLYTHTSRMMYATGAADELQSMTQWRAETTFRRIVGYTRGEVTDVKKARLRLQEWLPFGVQSMNSRIMREVGQKETVWSLVEQIDEFGRGLGLSQRIWATLRGPNSTTAGKARQTAEKLLKVTRTGVKSSFLGVFLSSSASSTTSPRRSFPANLPERSIFELFVDTNSEMNQAFQYAQELFSLFILALASKVESVNGRSWASGRTDGCNETLLENSTFKSVAEIVVDCNLSTNVDEAYNLIIPAFAKHNLLPNQQDHANQRNPLFDQNNSDQKESETAPRNGSQTRS